MKDDMNILTNIDAGNPYFGLMFKRGFYASLNGLLPRIHDDWGKWNCGGFGITYDKESPFHACTEGTSFLIVLGHYVSLDTELTEHGALTRFVFDKLLESEESFFSALDACCGRFVCFFSIGDEARVAGDATGMKMIHYTNGPHVAVASHASLLADVLKKEKSSAAREFLSEASPRKYNMAFLPGHATMYEGVRILAPNTYLDLASGNVERFYPRHALTPIKLEAAVIRASDQLSDIMEKFSRISPLAISLTAGLDSRLTAAAASRVKDNVRFFSYIRAREKVNVADALIASRISAENDLDYMQIVFDYEKEESGANQDYVQFREIAETSTDFEHFYPLAYAYIKTFPDDRLHVRSNIGEICRARYHTAPFDSIINGNETETAKLVAIYNIWTGAKSHSFATEELTRYLHETKLLSLNHGFDLPALYYWELLMPVWHGSLLLESDLSHDTVCLYNCRDLLATFLAMDFDAQVSKKGMLDCIDRLWPELLKEPINPRLDDLPKSEVEDFLTKAGEYA